MNCMKRWICFVAAAALLAACSPRFDYEAVESWVYCETEEEGAADVFFVAPTVYSGSEEQPLMPADDKEAAAAFLGAVNMEKGIYDGRTRFFAPFYRQAGLYVYTLGEAAREPFLSEAYRDVRRAFLFYLSEWGEDRPLILAGFSQGADMCLRLMKEFFGDETLSGRLIACYAVGWRLPHRECSAFPHLKPAQAADDLGVIVMFNSEAPEVADSLIVPEGTATAAINPLNWRTDSAPAERSLNLGACFTDYEGRILREEAAFSGAYLDPVRGTLKVTDVDAADWPPVLEIFPEGVYHLYDYQFFYRNLEENVRLRIEKYAENR